MALLLCSLLMYNSVGPIDENVLNNLSLVVNLSKSLQIKKGEKATDADEMAQYFPSFLWILRDFALRLEDQDGNTITMKKYLENSLQEQKGMSDAIEAKNRIRRLVSQFFQDRDCHTLVRPVEEESDLQALATLPSDQLRGQFNLQIEALRKKVFKKVKPKELKGKCVNGSQLCDLAEAYVEALNKGGIPVIESAWEYMQSGELENAYKNTIEFYQNEVNHKILSILPCTEDDMRKNMKDIKEQGISLFKQNTLGDINNTKNQKYLKKIKEGFHEIKENANNKNNDVVLRSCRNMLE